MENKEIIEVTENVNELVEAFTVSQKVKTAAKIGVGIGGAIGVGGLIALLVKKTKDFRIKKASEYLEKNGKIVLDSLEDDAEIIAETGLFSEEE